MNKMIYNFWVSVLRENRLMWKLCIKYYARKENGVWNSKTLRKLYEEKRKISAGKWSYGWESLDLQGPINVGNYVSIGPNVKRLVVNHYVETITTHPCLFNPAFGWVNEDNREREILHIGNDVWIGANVMILPGVRSIGNGSVIAAGAVVTKDVPSYCIYGGVPAKLIKRRFPEELALELEDIKWWEIDEDELKKIMLTYKTPTDFVNVFRGIYNKNEYIK